MPSPCSGRKIPPLPKLQSCIPKELGCGVLFVEFSESLKAWKLFHFVSDTVLAPAQDFIVLKFH